MVSTAFTFAFMSYTAKMARLCYGYFVLAIARICKDQKLNFWLKLWLKLYIYSQHS
ncbi:hypothetical protein [Pseudanabaena sp. ABRG5-3]|uniref:hypothetical protein n=1 Tax=Pseudanabaena sp. ABRG5-3 TaxID=685565 RepID=UPI0013A6036D|nr:hypothetical protein [Pseudanabaena sp. ABRG5-3]